MFGKLVKIVDGCWEIQPLGYGVLFVILGVLLLTIPFISKNKRQSNQTIYGPKKLVFASVCMALAVITSNIKFLKLPMGGSTTLFSMLFICLIGSMFGLRIGITSAVAYGLLQLFIDPYVIGLPQLFFDYILAFGSLGLSGMFCNSKHGILKGYILGVFGRFVFSVISGIIFFGTDSFMASLSYSITYNASYLLPELILTIVVLLVPAVSSALLQVKKYALQ